MKTIEKCPTCGRAGDELGQCGSFLLCPVKDGEGGAEITTQDVILHCEPCNITRVMSAPSIIRGKAIPSGAEWTCPREDCQCKPSVLSPEGAGRPAKVTATKAAPKAADSEQG